MPKIKGSILSNINKLRSDSDLGGKYLIELLGKAILVILQNFCCILISFPVFMSRTTNATSPGEFEFHHRKRLHDSLLTLDC